MDLLLIEEDGVRHYVLIQDFNWCLFNKTKHEGRKHFGRYCFQSFTTSEILKNHTEVCLEINGKQTIVMPEPGSEIKFHNHQKELQVPFVIYADFEAITESISSCQPSDERSFSKPFQKHTDCGYGYKLVCCYDDAYSKPVSIYRFENAVYKFIEEIFIEVEYCQKMMKLHFNEPMKK